MRLSLVLLIAVGKLNKPDKSAPIPMMPDYYFEEYGYDKHGNLNTASARDITLARQLHNQLITVANMAVDMLGISAMTDRYQNFILDVATRIPR